MKLRIRLFLLFSIVYTTSLFAQIEGTWYANLNAAGINIPLVFNFEKTSNNKWNGTLDSPNQQMFDLQLDLVQFKNDSLQLKANALGIYYKGKKNNKAINGVFKQGMFKAELALTREQKKPEEKKLNRPQEPKPPFPYTEETIQFLNKKDSITLAGTLTYPKNKSNYPIVVMISGSGAQDRNSEILGHKPFWVAADYLTRNGIGVLRFDDRGTAESEGDFSKATSLDFMEDAYAAVQFLKDDLRFKHTEIGLYGHSEGGMIAPLLANTYTNKVDFLVLLAAPAVAITDLMLKQQELVSLASGIDDEEIKINAKINSGAYQLITQFEATENSSLQNELQNYFTKVTEEYPQIGASMGLSNQRYIISMVSAYTNPWMVYFLKYKPKEHLKNLKLPVLALFAENDLQVSAQENSTKMKELILGKNPKNEVKTFSNKNHLFQNSETGNIAEYAEIEETISTEVLQKIASWVKSL